MSQAEENLIDTGLRVVKAAEDQDVTLRLLGAIAVRLHCPRFAWLHKALGRTISDLDFIAYSKDKNRVDKLLSGLGFVKRPTSLAAVYSSREIYHDKNGQTVVDVFFDRLQMSHTIEYKGLLELDYPTIPLAEMLLQKLQIVKFTEKDLKDVAVLLREHELGENDSDTVNVGRICKVLSRDWGFYHTATENLKKTSGLLSRLDQLSDEDRQNILGKLGELLSRVERHPKTMSWKLRAKVGTSVKWYKDVERFEFEAPPG